jgi:hypothetical protein
MNDMVNHPPHYNSHPSGIEAIEVAELMPYCLGNVWKYVFRAGKKWDDIQDLKKAQWYLARSIEQPEWIYQTRLPSPSLAIAMSRDVDRVVRAEPDHIKGLCLRNIGLMAVEHDRERFEQKANNAFVAIDNYIKALEKTNGVVESGEEPKS